MLQLVSDCNATMIMWKSLVLGVVVICLTLTVSNSNGELFMRIKSSLFDHISEEGSHRSLVSSTSQLEQLEARAPADIMSDLGMND